MFVFLPAQKKMLLFQLGKMTNEENILKNK